MSPIFTRTVLAGSGAILGMIGGALLFAPKTFLEMSNVIVEHDPSLMSELTAPSGVLLITGTLMILGAAKQRLTDLSLVSGAIIYGGYGVGRLVSVGLQGVPSRSLIAAMLIELAIAGLLIVIRMRRTSADQLDRTSHGLPVTVQAPTCS